MNTRFDISYEQEELRRLTRQIAEKEFKPQALTWERTGEFPWRNMKILADAGILGATVPLEYGGGGGNWLDAALILEELGRCCYTTAMAALGELGVQTRAIASYGRDEQKQRYLPMVARGELICAICITEPDVGSDIASISTTARADGIDIVVDGKKTLISRGDVAGLFMVYVRFLDLPSSPPPIGVVLIERDAAGFAVNQRFDTLGGEGLFELTLDDVRVPRDNVLVREDGFRKMLQAFNGQRCLNGSISLGIAQGAQDAAVQYAMERVQGGRPISDHQGIRWMLADNEIDIVAARALIRRAAAVAEGGFPDRYEAAIAKTFANEMSLRVTDRVMQVFGGHGWLKEMPAERYLRWARYGPLGGGTPQIQRNGIAHHLLRGSRGSTS